MLRLKGGVLEDTQSNTETPGPRRTLKRPRGFFYGGYTELVNLRDRLVEKLKELPDFYDESDIGNEIGIIVGEGTESNIENFKSGINHGISLSDGTHP